MVRVQQKAGGFSTLALSGFENSTRINFVTQLREYFTVGKIKFYFQKFACP